MLTLVCQPPHAPPYRDAQVDQADIDIVLVGDSVSMVVHGHDTTLPITLDDMLSHCKAVSRGAARAFLVGDLPFGSYELSATDAVRSAVRMLKEGGMDAVKLEGEGARAGRDRVSCVVARWCLVGAARTAGASLVAAPACCVAAH